MKVVHLSAHDINGGAARAAYRLHQGLRLNGVDSAMLVAHQSSRDSSVSQVMLSANLGSRLKRHSRQRLLQHDFAHYELTRPVGLERFSDDRSSYDAELLKNLAPCDIVNLHWVADFVDYQTFFEHLPSNTSIVWTLHDMNAFTGGCHYNMECDRYTQQCGACPQLGSSSETDLSRQIWLRKQKAFAAIDPNRLHIVTPSRWLQREAAKSSLLGRYASSVIPYGLDTNIFSPRPREATREALSISKTAKVVLFAAESVANRRKGFALLAEALSELPQGMEVLLLSVGSEKPEIKVEIPHLHLGQIKNDFLLPLAYSAADVFVIPSLQDNLPNTVVESMACGTPVIGFDVGGIPDMVRPGITGELVALGDVPALRETIVKLLQDSSLRAAMSEKSREVAVREYAQELQAQKYFDLYTDLIRTKVQTA